MKVWTYWEGPQPPHIKVCLGSMVNVLGSDLTILDPNSAVKAVGSNLNRNWRRLSQPALKADAIRAALLALYGGWWWDADTIAFRKPEFDYTSSVIYTTWTKDPVRVLNGYIWFPPNSPIAAKWLDSVNTALNKPTSVDWTSIGEKLLTGLVLNDLKAFRIDRAQVLPVDIDSNVAHFFEDRPLEPYLESNPICFGLNHSWFIYHKPNQMDVNSWNGTLLIHKLLRRAVYEG